MDPILVQFITIAIAAGTLTIAFVTWLSKSKNETGDIKAEDARLFTKLEFIGDDVKDIKAEYRNFRNELTEVRGIASHADDRAEAAHRRLDRLETNNGIHEES